MIKEAYEVELGADFRVFEFDSEGPNGTIRKVVQYTEIEVKNYFNLGFGDKNIETGSIDDLVITNNGDSQKVLATVASTLYVFMNHHPDASVIAIGSTLARTRLYRIGITNNLKMIERDFNIYGLERNVWEKFMKGKEYEAFLVTRGKSSKFNYYEG